MNPITIYFSFFDNISITKSEMNSDAFIAGLQQESGNSCFNLRTGLLLRDGSIASSKLCQSLNQ